MKARGAVVATLLVVLLLSALYPIRQYVGQKNDLKRLTAEEAGLAARIEGLKSVRSRLLTDEEIERIAREELGMVRPGEVAFVVVPGVGTAARVPPEAPAVDTAMRARDKPAWFERWWGTVIRSLTEMR